ncbi:MAG: tetratricopeptide repeat protein [Armatimonadetes bacterium]|nr:tetratricopeptide repeat protein [Armatimonadota bacterium]
MRWTLALVVVLGLSGACRASVPGGPGDATLDLWDLADSRPAAWLPLPILVQAGDAFAVSLRPCLTSPSIPARARAAFLMGESAYPKAACWLKPLQADGSRLVRLMAGISLARLGDETGLPAAAAALTSSRSWQRYYGVLALWTLGGERARRLAEESASGQPAFVAECLRQALHDWPVGAKTRFSHRRPVEAPATLAEDDAVLAAVNAFIMESDWWWHRGVYDQVIRANDVVTFLDPTAVEQYTNSAWLLWSMGRTAEAIGEYHRCIRQNPRDPHGYYYLGTYYLQHDQPAAGMPYLQKAVELEPENPLSRRALAHCLEKIGHLDEALAQWETILKLNPTDGAALHNRDRVRKELESRGKS